MLAILETIKKEKNVLQERVTTLEVQVTLAANEVDRLKAELVTINTEST